MAALGIRSRSLYWLLGVAEPSTAHSSGLDPLTSLPNREVLRRRLQRLLVVRRAQLRSELCTVLLIDCDGFRMVNHALGHLGGDRVLSGIAERLCELLPGAHTIARTGGDEFAVVFDRGVPGAELVAETEALLGRLHEPLAVAGATLRVEASAGAVMCRRQDAAGGADAVLRRATVALKLAKQRGKGRVAVYEPSMQLALAQPERRHAELDSALSAREFAVRYQPVVRLPERAVTGYQALLRWRREGGRDLEPQLFLRELEATGLIDAVGAWVLGEAMARTAELREYGGITASVAVNVAPSQLRSGRFVEMVMGSLQAYDLEPARLTLQLTPAAVAAEDPAALATAVELRRHGVRLMVDDVGSGDFERSHLRRMPVDFLKLPRALTLQLGGDGPLPPAVADLVRLSRDAGLTLVADGVETEVQHRAVVDLGCEYAQGQLYGTPLSAEQLPMQVPGERDGAA